MKRLALIGPLAALAIAAAIYGAVRTRTASGNERAYRTAVVQRGDVTQLVTASGTLSALTTVAVGSQVSGNIARLHVDYNANVAAGQLLAEIDPSTYQARLVQAEADLLSAQATLDLKQLNARRLAELLAHALVPQSDYDQAAAELRQQQAATRKSEAAVENARVDLARCQIHSPIAGVVLSRAVDVGQTVQANFSAPTLFTLAQDLRQMQITSSISEADIGHISAGLSATFTVDAFPGRSFRGVVREVRNNATTTNNVVTYPTIILVENTDLKLRPGMTANVTITTAHRAGVLRVPNAALRFRVPAGAAVRAASATEATPAAANNPMPPPTGEFPEPPLESLPAEIRQRLLAEFDRDQNGTLDTEEKTVLRATMRTRYVAGATPSPVGLQENAARLFTASERPPAPPGADGAAPSSSPPAPNPTIDETSPTPSQARTLYVLAARDPRPAVSTSELIATPVRIGLADTSYTEIVSGLAEGATIVVGTLAPGTIASAETVASNGSTNPFAPPRPPGGGPPPR